MKKLLTQFVNHTTVRFICWYEKRKVEAGMLLTEDREYMGLVMKVQVSALNTAAPMDEFTALKETLVVLDKDMDLKDL